MTEPPHHDYPDKMMRLICHHYKKGSNKFSSKNISHYLRVIIFGCYNVETKNAIDTLASEGSVTFYITSRLR
jgi:hypothetical protein